VLPSSSPTSSDRSPTSSDRRASPSSADLRLRFRAVGRPSAAAELLQAAADSPHRLVAPAVCTSRRARQDPPARRPPSASSTARSRHPAAVPCSALQRAGGLWLALLATSTSPRAPLGAGSATGRAKRKMPFCRFAPAKQL
jgi:hypothetical protein